MAFHIGVDLGGTTTCAGIVSDNGTLICSHTVKTACGNTEILRGIISAIEIVCEKANLKTADISSIGVGVPGSVFPPDTVSFACNINMSDYPLGRLLHDHFAVPVFLQNDANCAALAEYNVADCTSLLMLTIGTGIGGAYIENGKIMCGHNGAGLEVGHHVIVHGGKPCACGRNGCFETYASTFALCDMVRSHIEDCPSSKCAEIARNYDGIDARILFDSMRYGDSMASEIFEVYISYLSCGIVNLINIFQPEILVIGGAIAQQGETLLSPIRNIVMRENYARNLEPCTKIIGAKYLNSAGIIGAGLLYRNGENYVNF